MRYYTQTIPIDLAEKLKEKGMPIFIEQEWYPNGMPQAEKDCHKPMTKYCEVFDWLIAEKWLHIWIEPYIYESDERFSFRINFGSDKRIFETWHEAANAAIDKALELIKEK